MAALHGDDIPDRQRCSATGKKSGVRCKRYAIPGGTVCEYHGGKAPQVAAKARERIERAQAEAAAMKLGVPIETTPEQALLDRISSYAGIVAYFEARVQELDNENLTWGKTKQVSGGVYAGTTYEAGPPVVLKLYGEWSDRLERASIAAIKAGIDERKVKLAESQGTLVASAIRRILDRLDLDERQIALVPIIVPEELRALTAV